MYKNHQPNEPRYFELLHNNEKYLIRDRVTGDSFWVRPANDSDIVDMELRIGERKVKLTRIERPDVDLD